MALSHAGVAECTDIIVLCSYAGLDVPTCTPVATSYARAVGPSHAEVGGLTDISVALLPTGAVGPICILCPPVMQRLDLQTYLWPSFMQSY